MKSGKTFGPETPPDEGDIEQIFELSRSEEKANWADFKPTLERLQLKAGEPPVTRRPKFFSLPRLVMAGMAAVIVALALGLITITLLTSKEVTPTAVANQPVPTANTATPLPASSPTLPATGSTGLTGLTLTPAAQTPNPTNPTETRPGTATPVATTQPAPPTNLPSGQSPATANLIGSVGQVSDPTPTAIAATIPPTPTAAIPTKLAIQTPIGAVANTPPGQGQPGSPMTIFGTLLSSSGNGNNTVLNVRTTEGVLVVRVSGTTKIANSDPAKGRDLSGLTAGTTLSATGPLNAQGQLEATSLTINPQARPPLVTPGYPDDTK